MPSATPCFFSDKNHPRDSWQSPFLPCGYTSGDEYVSPYFWPRVPSSLLPFHHNTSFLKKLFPCAFLGISICSPRHTPLVAPFVPLFCMLLQGACLGKTCLTLGTSMVFCYFVKVCNPKSMILVNTNV